MTSYHTERQKLLSQICTWTNRADMAKKAEKPKLVEAALRQADIYQQKLDSLEPPDESDTPNDSAGVPKQPKPYSGAGAVALPIPKDKKEES